MTPKEKAKNLYSTYQFVMYYFNVKSANDIAKQCALRAVNEITEAIDWHEFETPNKEFNYWNEVKQEIEKL